MIDLSIKHACTLARTCKGVGRNAPTSARKVLMPVLLALRSMPEQVLRERLPDWWCQVAAVSLLWAALCL